MPIQLTVLPPSGKSRLPVDEVSDDTKVAVDEAFEWCKTNDGRLEAAFGTQEEAERFLKEARSYAYSHDPRLVVTGNTTQKGAARFRVELYVASATEETTETAAADSASAT